MSMMMRHNRQVIPINYISPPTLFERHKTRYPLDLRWAGQNSEVRIIQPARKAKHG